MRLPLLFLFAVLVVWPGSAAAAGGPFASGQLLLASGQPDLLTPLPAPDGPAFAFTNGTGASDDGRYVVFDGLVAGLSDADDDRFLSVFVKDRLTGAVTLASRGGAGVLTTWSSARGISDDGGRVLFATPAGIAADDTNAAPDLYVRDIAAGTTTLVSRRNGAAGSAIGAVDDGVLSGNGRHVAFATDAGDADPTVTDGNGADDVYVRDIGAGTTALASRGAAAIAVGGNDPSLSDDGVVVAFTTSAPLAGALDTNGGADAYVRVVPPPSSTQLASRTNGGGGAPATGGAVEAVISGDGSTVAWSTTATDVGNGDTTPLSDIHRSVLGSGTTTLVSRNAGGDPGNGDSSDPTISDDGRTVGFVSDAANLDQFFPDTNPGEDAFVRRTAVNETELSTRRGPGEVQPGADVRAISLSGDGTQLVIAGGATLAPDLDPRFEHVVVRDQGSLPRRTETVSRPAGTAAIVSADGPAHLDDARRAMSADGRYVVFTADQPGLAGAAPQVSSAYRRDLVTGAVVPVALGAGGTIVTARALAVSDDGSRVLFATVAALDPADGNGSTDLYLRDLTAGTTLLATRADGVAGAVQNGATQRGDLSGDGRRVAFSTTATNLGNGDTSNVASVHVRDLTAGVTLLASRGQGAGGAVNTALADDVSLNQDGGVVAFSSSGPGYGDGGAGVNRQIHVRDLAAGTNVLASASAGGVQGDAFSVRPSLSADGRTVAFDTSAKNLMADDTDTFSDVVVKDLATGVVLLASRADGAAGANMPAAVSGPSLSADGSRVAFISGAATLDPSAPMSGRAAYVRDLGAGTTRVVSHRTSETRGTDPDATQVALSADGGCAAFAAAGQWFAASGDQVYVRALREGCVPSPAPVPSPVVGVPGGGAGGPNATQRDRTAPRIRAVSVRPSRVRRGRAFTIRFALSEPASVRLRIARVTTGRRVGTRCRTATPKLRRRKRCELLVTRATVSRALKAGAVSMRVGGRPGGRRLAAGRHVLLLTAVDAAGNRSAEVRFRLNVRR